MGEVLCSTENSPFLIIDHIHAKINRVCCAALAIGKRCMNVRKNKLCSLEIVENNNYKRNPDFLYNLFSFKSKEKQTNKKHTFYQVFSIKFLMKKKKK